MKRFVFIFIILITISCGNSDDNTSLNPISIEFTVLGNGLGGNETDTFEGIVISNQTDWENFLNYSIYPSFADQLSELEINFEESKIVALISDIQPHTGFSIHVTDIMEYDNQIIVQSEVADSGYGFTVLCQSFVVVKIPITTKPILFH